MTMLTFGEIFMLVVKNIDIQFLISLLKADI